MTTLTPTQLDSMGLVQPTSPEKQGRKRGLPNGAGVTGSPYKKRAILLPGNQSPASNTASKAAEVACVALSPSKGSSSSSTGSMSPLSIDKMWLTQKDPTRTVSVSPSSQSSLTSFDQRSPRALSPCSDGSAGKNSLYLNKKNLELLETTPPGADMGWPDSFHRALPSSANSTEVAERCMAMLMAGGFFSGEFVPPRPPEDNDVEILSGGTVMLDEAGDIQQNSQGHPIVHLQESP